MRNSCQALIDGPALDSGDNHDKDERDDAADLDEGHIPFDRFQLASRPADIAGEIRAAGHKEGAQSRYVWCGGDQLRS